MPITLSRFSSITGILVKPERSASESPWRSVLSPSIQTISVLGTINSRIKVSPNSNTDWIISRSDSSTKPCWLA